MKVSKILHVTSTFEPEIEDFIMIKMLFAMTCRNEGLSPESLGQ